MAKDGPVNMVVRFGGSATGLFEIGYLTADLYQLVAFAELLSA